MRMLSLDVNIRDEYVLDCDFITAHRLTLRTEEHSEHYSSANFSLLVFVFDSGVLAMPEQLRTSKVFLQSKGRL